MALHQDPFRDLLELATVHAFYVELLEKAAGHPVPVPRQPCSAGDRVGHSICVLRHWLDIIDMAIRPVTLRDSLRRLGSGDAPEALLRYYVLKKSHRDTDRDKADFVASYLYRHPSEWRRRRIGALTEADDVTTLAIAKAQEFEQELAAILDAGLPDLPKEHQQLLREFEFLYHQIEDLRHFDALMDSGIVQRVREMKAAFGPSFYHPRVLAHISVYNTFFGQHFDRLFTQAAQQIKTFAAKTQEEGGSILARVEGDVTVKNLAEVEEQKIHEAEYSTAQEDFRKVSRFKKAVDKRRSGHRAEPAAPAVAAPAAAVSAPSEAAPANVESAFARQTGGPALANLEQGKLRTVLESIRNFVRAAERGFDNVVPLRGGNVVLAPAEVEAFRTDFGQEKSFRADLANFFMEAVALHTRMMHELTEYKARKDSAYLWKPHADALTYLLTASGQCIESGKAVLAVSEQRGLPEKSKALGAGMDKLRAQMQYVAKAWQG